MIHLQALSIEGQNPYILELLNVALESAAEILPDTRQETDGAWLNKVREMRAGDIRLGLGAIVSEADASTEEMNVDSSL